jgi:2-keto-4-pentenoate hydratase/2-oxohepta-3-ene-1,7-dioic acid hydratase in catechol pathway
MDKIICVGKNYLKHAHELGDGVPEEPLIFLKPPSTILSAQNGETPLELPTKGEIHHEVEIVLRLKKTPHGWSFSHFTIGLDLTIRDVQNVLKKAGQPWEKAKVFRNSAVLGPWIEIHDLEKLMSEPFSIAVNQQVRQNGYGRDMRWKPLELLSHLHPWLPLVDGDILFTGTPEGVGALISGDALEVNGPGIAYRLLCK